MPVNRKETIRDPNSFGDIDYELLIDFNLIVDGYLHNTPPVKEYSWEEFENILDNVGEFYSVGLYLRGYSTDTKTFEKRLTILIQHKTATVPFTSRSYFSPLTNTTIAELISLIEYLTHSPGIDDINKVLDLVEESADKTLETLKGTQ